MLPRPRTLLVLALALLTALPVSGNMFENIDADLRLDPVTAPGLRDTVRVIRAEHNVPYIFAFNDDDALFMLGYLHARDRFFQMDTLRRTFSGTLAEILGDGALASDIQLRTLGLRRAAEASLPALTDETRRWLDAYVAGVNAWLASDEPLGPEYTALELTKAGIAPWTAIDSVTITKGLAFGLSFDLSDLDNTQALLTFQGTGAVAGFDGTALFNDDLYRSAPFDPSVSIPDFLTTAGIIDAVSSTPTVSPNSSPSYLGDSTLRLIERYQEAARNVPMLRRALSGERGTTGSNWFIAGGALTDTGRPIMANDPHLALDVPSTFYESHMRVRAGEDDPMYVVGVSFPGTPGNVLGCTPWVCWGATVNPLDVTDVYQEQLVVDPALGPVATLYQGAPEPLVPIFQTFLVNQIGDSTLDNVADAGVPLEAGGVTLVVPRRNNGPLVQFDLSDPNNPSGFSVQYTGWGPTRELDTLRIWARARNIDDFREGLQFFDVGSQNWAFVDVEGNIAYFTSAEMPLREDLEDLGAPAGGVPPWFVRDGSGTLQHEWKAADNPPAEQSLPYAILPFDEMPQVINPDSGYILNANQDPVGTTLDNNALDQVRSTGGLYYLNPGYASGFRMGRIQRLFDNAAGPITIDDMKAFQANNALLDAEDLLPFVDAAINRAGDPGAPVALAALLGDPEVVEAAGRLLTWDYTTPTGITEGYDPGDDPDNLQPPGEAEGDASVAATIYSMWRTRMVANVIDAPLTATGLDGFGPGSSLAVTALLHHLSTAEASGGVGASGIPFIQVPGIADVLDARAFIILTSLREALDALAGPDFANAFGMSTDQDTYRWGRLHRITFDHPLGQPFSVPAGGGFTDLDPNLPGIARSGGFGAVDASAHSARADGENEFMFGSGPSRRFVGQMNAFNDLDLYQVIPGGEVGVLGDPFYADQLDLWLTNDYHSLWVRPIDVLDDLLSFQLFQP
ncbi:MAG: penicillin acylase family protein [Acidobacteriota bacterium]